MFKVPNKNRVRTGYLGSYDNEGSNGLFLFKQNNNRPDLMVIASDQMGWEHVSVSTQIRTPTWEEMCMIKDTFWSKDTCTIQYHPPESEYVNNHPYCLHIWNPIGINFPKPPTFMIGIKS